MHAIEVIVMIEMIVVTNDVDDTYDDDDDDTDTDVYGYTRDHDGYDDGEYHFWYLTVFFVQCRNK